VILIFAGLALDSTVLSVSKTEQRQLAENVALAALTTYLNSPPTDPLNTRLTAVKNKAQEIIRGNITFTRTFMDTPSPADDVETQRGTVVGGLNGTLVPGIWYALKPTDCTIFPAGTVCPCDGGANPWINPCFQEVDIDVLPIPTINAFRADLKLEGSSAIKTLFSSVYSSPSSNPLRSSATATTYPRHGIFLVDLSRSSHEETHQPYEATAGNGVGMLLSSEYAFSVNGSATDVNGCRTAAPLAWPLPAIGGPCDIRGGVVPQLYRNLWYGAGGYIFIPSFPAPAPNPRLRKHMKDDYVPYELSWTDPGIRPAPPFSETYLVDMWQNAAITPTSYEGPEPLNSMIAGVNRALSRVAANTVAGDQVGFIGFDYSARVTQREYGLQAPGSPLYLQLQNLTDPTNPPPQCLETPGRTVKECRVRNHLLITRKESSANLPEALRAARQLFLTAGNPMGAEEFVAVMSDGITNCTGNRVCGTNQLNVDNSIAEVETIVRASYVPDAIKLHFIHIGDTAGPHTLLAPSPTRKRADGRSAGCMTEEESRKVSASPTVPLQNYKTTGNNFSGALLNSGSTFNVTNNTYNHVQHYYEPNRLKAVVAETGGFWAPVRPACTPGANVTPALEAACNGGTFSQVGGVPTTINLPPYTDPNGRIMCEPDDTDTFAPVPPPSAGAPIQPRSSKRTQIYRAIDQMLARSPYVVVQ